jgi:hypothetical protein
MLPFAATVASKNVSVHRKERNDREDEKVMFVD